MGVIEDTHMPDNGFSHLAMAFYVSFLVCEPLQSFLIQRLPTAKLLGANGKTTRGLFRTAIDVNQSLSGVSLLP